MNKLTIFTLILLLLSVSVSVFGVKSQDGLWECAFNDEMEAEILAYHGTEAEIVIPEFVDGYQVIAIGDEAFRGRYDLTAITLPESIMSIGNNAFRNSSITTINLPDNIFSLGNGAFASCLKLTSIIIPPYITEISTSIFWGCTNLTSITLHDEVSTIGYGAFAMCANLEELALPESVIAIKADAFYGCSNLKEIALPKKLTVLGEGVFGDCVSLAKIEIPEGVTSIGAYTFSKCSSLTEVILPNSITSIGETAFTNCSSLTKITLPESMEKIGEGAFWGCASLVSIDIPMSVTSIGSATWADCENLESINVAEGNKNYVNVDGILFNIDKTLLLCYPSQRKGAYIVPDSVTEISILAFNKCKYLTEVTIPNSVEVMEINFGACENLTAINILEGNQNYTDIDGVLFNNNKKRLIAYPGGKEGAYIIPSSVTEIMYSAFFGCPKLTSVTIPKSVKNVSGGFKDCPLLESVTLSEGIKSVENYTFDNCPDLTELALPDSLTDIGNLAVSGDNNLKAINVSDKNRTYTSIDGVLFRKGKSEIVIYPNKKGGEYAIPDGVKKIGGYAFYECTELTAIEIPSSVTSIEGRIFEGCTELTSVIIPDSVTEMGSRTFAYCEKLKFVYIPESVTKIGYGMLLGSNDAIIITPKGSFAEEYAKKNNFRFSNELVD